LAGVVRVDSARHAKHPREVHGEEGEVHGDEVEPEVHFAEFFVHHASEHLGEVIVDAGEDPHDGTAEEDVVEVGDDEVAVGLLHVGWRRRVHDAGDAADGE